MLTLTIVEAAGSVISKHLYQSVSPEIFSSEIFSHLFGSSTCLHWLAVFWHRNSQLPLIWCLQKYLEKVGLSLTTRYQVLILTLLVPSVLWS